MYKLLITNNHLNTLGGSETWVWTVKEVLERKGFKVDIFTFHFTSHPDVFSPVEMPDEKYDLVLCNHNSCFQFVKKFIRYEKLTFISHGFAHWLETPHAGADRYISVSEEVRLKQLQNTGINSTVILNPVDLEKFYPEREPKRPPKIALGLFQGPEAHRHVSDLDLQFYVTPINRNERIKLTNQRFNIVDIVFSLGRGAYEGLASGRPVIIYDSRSYQGELYDGLITNENIHKLVQCNCSGRATWGQFSIERVNEEMSQIQNSEYYRSIAEEYFDADKICEQLIQ